MSEPNANVVEDLNKALINSNSGSDKNEVAVLMMSPNVNWAEFLSPAPMTIALLGQLVLIASEEGFRHIKHPEGFRECLVQVSNTGWRAFNEAHKVRGVNYTYPKGRGGRALCKCFGGGVQQAHGNPYPVLDHDLILILQSYSTKTSHPIPE